MSALELLASKAAPVISACEMHGVVCGFCITQPFGYAMEELIELFGNEEVVDQEMLESFVQAINCLLYTSPSPRDGLLSRMPSSA